MAAASRKGGKKAAPLKRRGAYLPRRPSGSPTCIRSVYASWWPGPGDAACATRGRAPDLGFVCAQCGFVARRDGAPAKDLVEDSPLFGGLQVPVADTNNVACARRGRSHPRHPCLCRDRWVQRWVRVRRDPGRVSSAWICFRPWFLNRRVSGFHSHTSFIGGVPLSRMEDGQS